MRRVLAGVLLCVGVTRPVHAGPLESSERRNDVFGTAVAIDGDRLAVGAPGVDDDGFNAGLIYVFEREGGEWRRDAAVPPDEPIGLSYFGAIVAPRGDVLVVGAPFDWEESVHDRRGAGYVFVRSSGAWEQWYEPGSMVHARYLRREPPYEYVCLSVQCGRSSRFP